MKWLVRSDSKTEVTIVSYNLYEVTGNLHGPLIVKYEISFIGNILNCINVIACVIFLSEMEMKSFKSFKNTRFVQRMSKSLAHDSQNTQNSIFSFERLVFAKRLTVAPPLVLRLSIDSQKKCVFYHSGYP